MNQKSKSEKVKLAVVVALCGGLLAALLLQPQPNAAVSSTTTVPTKDARGTVGTAPIQIRSSPKLLSANHRVSEARTAMHPESQQLKEFTLYKLEEIISINPFERPSVVVNLPEPPKQIGTYESIAAPSQPISLTATYSGLRGSIALVDQQIVKVGEPLSNAEVVEIGVGILKLAIPDEPLSP